MARQLVELTVDTTALRAVVDRELERLADLVQFEPLGALQLTCTSEGSYYCATDAAGNGFTGLNQVSMDRPDLGWWISEARTDCSGRRWTRWFIAITNDHGHLVEVPLRSKEEEECES